MKQGTKFTLAVKLRNVNLASIQKVEFLFKGKRDRTAEALKTAVFPGDAVLSETEENTFYIPFTREDTYRFPVGRPFYLDTRVSLFGVRDNPATPIVRLKMSPTLFDEEEEG